MKTIKSEEEFERVFDGGESILDYCDMDTLRPLHPAQSGQKAMSLSLPVWLVGDLDAEASRRGISRQAVVKTWLVDRADAERERRARASA